ncbi:MAG: aspartyl/asparaginyl beta-hydroxylase domain-containing protein [Pyrinomonadaceae bacterium]
MKNSKNNLPPELVDFLGRNSQRATPMECAPPVEKADGEWVYYRSGLPWLLLDLQFPYQEMSVEAQRLLPEFIPSYHEKGKGWKYLPLMEEDGGAEPPGWTLSAERCPVIKRFFTDQWPYGSVSRVRLMALLPGGYLLPHTDPYQLVAGPPHSLESFQFSLATPRGSLYGFEKGGLIPWKPGQCYAIDLSYKHALLNQSDETRINLIIAHRAMNWTEMSRLFERSFRDSRQRSERVDMRNGRQEF